MDGANPVAEIRILVVEDYDDVRAMMRIFLELHGYTVFEASDGYEAVQMARRHIPDLILLDLAMPVMDGLEAAAKIRSHSEIAAIPIVAVTAFDDSFREKALSAGCNEVIAKPIDIEQLRSIVHSYVKPSDDFSA